MFHQENPYDSIDEVPSCDLFHQNPYPDTYTINLRQLADIHNQYIDQVHFVKCIVPDLKGCEYL